MLRLYTLRALPRSIKTIWDWTGRSPCTKHKMSGDCWQRSPRNSDKIIFFFRSSKCGCCRSWRIQAMQTGSLWLGEINDHLWSWHPWSSHCSSSSIFFFWSPCVNKQCRCLVLSHIPLRTRYIFRCGLNDTLPVQNYKMAGEIWQHNWIKHWDLFSRISDIYLLKV